MLSNNEKMHWIFITLLFAVVIGLGFTRLAAMRGDYQERVCTVTEVDRKFNSDKDGTAFKYMVDTEECGTLQIKGGFQWGTFFPGKKAGELNIGETYTFSTVGERNTWLWTYPTVETIEVAK